MIDASHCKVHPHAAGARGENQDMSRTKGGSTQNFIWPWMHTVCQSKLLQKVQQHVNGGVKDTVIDTTADCTQAGKLITGLNAEHLLADREYDSNAIVKQAETQGMKSVIPPRKSRKEQRAYKKNLYKLRHLIENASCI